MAIPKARPKIKLLKDAEARRIPTATWLVEDVIHYPSFFMFHGPEESYKSFGAMSLAWCVAAGLPWLGIPTLKGPVVYVMGEGAYTYHDRREAWGTHHQQLADLENCYIYDEPLDLVEKSHMAALLDYLKRHELKPVLVQFDTLSMCMPGANDSGTSEASLVVHNINRLKAEIGCAVGVIHHNDKNNRRERGSTVFPGALDTKIWFDRKGKTVQIKCTKQKTAERFETIYTKFQTVAPSGLLVPIDEPAIDDLRNEILLLLAAAPNHRLTPKELYGSVKTRQERCCRIRLAELEEDGLVSKSGKGPLTQISLTTQGFKAIPAIRQNPAVS